MIFVIGGPTGSGKTSLAKTISLSMHAPILNADAYQVYRDMNIGTNKDLDLLKSFQHHLFDIINPDETFSVKDYQTHARSIIDQYPAPQPLVMVGGSGLYIKATLFDFQFLEHPKIPSLHLNPQEAYRRLLAVDPQSAKAIHPHNIRRVMRALAIYDSTGQTKSSIEARQSQAPKYPAVFLAINTPRDELYERIDQRVLTMVRQGLIEEVQSLIAKYPMAQVAFQAIGYKEVQSFLKGELSEQAMIEAIQLATRRYAKRQWTYFKHQLPTRWFDDEQAAMIWLKKNYGHLFT